jgi:alkanesulfonate monooxygenase SsuD/methylene tetrahydromethanopterin reductase-like flavin-dependent oxidoreductase (luciferase family)
LSNLAETGRWVEDLGFDALYVSDHPVWDPDCWVQLAVLAGATQRLRIGPLVACDAYRLPVVTARLAADIDGLSNGRLVLGLGIGWNMDDWGLGANEFTRLGLPYLPVQERQDALTEAVTIIRGVWGAEPFSFDGRYYSVAGAQVSPPPMQEPGPPFLIAGAGDRTLRQVALLADACNFGPGPTGGVHSPAQAARRLDVLRRLCALADRPFAHVLPTHLTTWLALAETPDAVESKVGRQFPEGLDEVWQKIVVACTPEEAVAYFQQLAAAGMRHFVVQNFDPEDQETIELLAARVAPAVQRTPA